MPLLARAAQFAPFSALAGYEDAVGEVARQTEERIELDAYEQSRLDRRFWLLHMRLAECPEVEITYFRQDSRKSGGAYIKSRGRIAKISMPDRMIFMEDGTMIGMDGICGMEGEIFDGEW